MNLFGWLKGRNPRNSMAASDDRAAEVAAAPSEREDLETDGFQWWRDAVNRGEHFRFDPDNCTFGQLFREPYMYVRLIDATSSDSGAPFAEIAEFLLSAGLGAVLRREGTMTADESNGILVVTCGDLVDFLLHGDLAVRDGSALGWDLPVDHDGLRIEAPGDDILLPKQRRILDQALRARGVADPKVALLTDRLGKRSIVFNLQSSGADREQLPQIAGFLSCFLPRHYQHIGFQDDSRMAIFPLLGSDAENPHPDGAGARAAQCRKTLSDPATRFQIPALQPLRDSDGTMFTKIRLLAPGSKQEGIPLDTLTLRLADAASGAIFYQEDDQDFDDNGGELTVFLGEMVDCLMTGKLGGRPIGHDGWGLGDDMSAGVFTNPDIQVLPIQSRLGILAVMKSCGSQELTVALNVNPDGLRSLHFGGWEDVYAYRGNAGVQVLAEAIGFCLPQHYVAVMNEPTLMSEKLTPRWEIWPWESQNEHKETEEPE